MIKNILKETIDNDSEGLTVKKLALKHGFSSRIISALKKPGRIMVNSEEKNINQFLKYGDMVELYIEDAQSESIVPQKMDLDILYEDEYILLINKPAGLVTHPTTYHFTDTLANGVVYHFQASGDVCKFRPVNRLDRDTSGLVLISKSQLSHSKLSKQMMKGQFEKEYLAIVHGNIDNNEGTIDYPIARKPGSIIERMVDESGQNAVTHYKVFSQNQTGSLVLIKLETGRTHQIRVHFSHIGHSLFGDDLYGGKREIIQRQALHCRKLKFLHPKDDKEVEFSAGLPEDIKELIRKIELEIRP